MALLVLIGASGSGKTAIAKAVGEARPDVAVFNFDQIGVPSPVDMIDQFGSPEAWQHAKTVEWMVRLAPVAAKRTVLFEGQARLSFLKDGAREAGGDLSYRPLLIDCNDAARRSRLSDRGQPELANSSMMSWAEYLRREAAGFGCETLDTSGLTVDSSADYVLAILEQMRPRDPAPLP